MATGPRKKPRTRRLRLVVLAVFAIGMFLSMGAYYEGCDNQPDPDGPFVDPPTASDYEAANAASTGDYCRQHKENLLNDRHDGYIDSNGDYVERWYAWTKTDWGYILDDPYCVNKGKVRWRNTQKYCHPVVWYVSQEECDFYTSECYDAAQVSGNRQCLTRLAAGFYVGVSIEGLPTNVRFNRCIATRVGPGGAHHRVIHKEHCDEIASAAEMLQMTGADDQEGGATPSAATTALSTDSTISPFGDTPELRLARLKRDHPALNDFVSRDQERRLEVVCGDGSFDDCKALATKIYRSLSPEQRRQVREAMRSTIGK